MIQAEQLVREYGSFRALDGVSFEVGDREIVGFLGPNGAGKTTTMKILTGFLAATSGWAKIQGLDVSQDTLAVRNKIGYLPESAPVYPDMNVEEYLRFVAEIRDIPAKEQTRAVETAMSKTSLTPRRYHEIRTLSKGYKQRVGLAQAILADPPILILDEPTSGLDPNQIIEIRDLIKALGQEKTVLFSTHIMQEVEATCQRALVIAKGKCLASGSIEELRGRGATKITVGFVKEDSGPQSYREAPSAFIREMLSKISGVSAVEEIAGEESMVRFSLQSSADPRADIFRATVEQKLTLLEMHKADASLESVFRALTQ
jgi:ABC-2 type transport system ATP-binding protein